MPSVFTTPGPIEIYWKQRINGATPANWSYLGTCLASPEVEIQDFYNEVYNDLGGRQVPTATVWDGERHNITLTLTRFDPYIYQSVRARAGNSVVIAAGENLVRGSLNTGFNDGMLLMVNAFDGGLLDNGLMPRGRMYYAVNYMAGRENTTGTRTLDVSLILRADGLFLPVTRQFALYTENAALWGTVPTPS